MTLDNSNKPSKYSSILNNNVLDGVFRKLQTPAAPHSGQALLGAAGPKIYSLAESDYLYTEEEPPLK